MERDASLDEFLDGAGEDTDSVDATPDSDTVADTEAAEVAAAEATDADSTVEPARSTGRWDPDSAVCDICGSTVNRRWREDEAFVCVECKSW